MTGVGNSNHLKQYVLVTSIKNEEANLSKLISSVVNQTHKPAVWVIVDDGSSDGSPEIIKDAREKHEWIQSIRLNETVRDVGVHLAGVIKEGFDFAIKYCNDRGIDFDYLGNVDGDLQLDQTYFENLISEFEKDRKLGITSGSEWVFDGTRMLQRKIRLPYGGAPLFRKTCFEDCGGITLSYAWDSVMNVKAELRGWDAKRFDDVRYIALRDGCDAEGLWKGFIQRGESDYFLGFNPLHSIAKSMKLPFLNWFNTIRRPYYISIAYLYGYFSSLITRRDRIKDNEILAYYRYTRSRQVIQKCFNGLSTMFKK